MIKKLVGAFRLYRFGMFRIYINKMFPNFFQFQTFLIYRFDLMDLKVLTSHSEVEFVKVEHPDHELFELFQKSFPARAFEERLREPNQVMYMALKNKQVSGYGWLASCHLNIDTIQYDYPLKNDEVFVHACFVPKHSRGMGIYPAMLKEMLRDSKTGGHKYVYIGVSAGNNGSIKGIEKAGFKRHHKISYLKIGRLKWWKGIDKEAVLQHSKSVTAGI